MKYVLLIPHGIRTGGPEALYQFADTLGKLGQNTSIWLYNSDDFNNLVALSQGGLIPPGSVLDVKGRHQNFDEYENYNVKYCDTVKFDQDTCFIFPEVICHWSILFFQFRSIIWWLSVDNSFSFLGQLNINFLRQKNIFHLYQSDYAKNFLEIINLDKKYRLCDYTPIPNSPINGDLKKHIISINCGQRNIFNIDEIKNNLENKLNLPIIPIRGMSRDEVYSTLEQSLVYIDLSRFPGKDRMPREAILRKAGTVVLQSGAYAEFCIPSEYTITIDQVNYLDILIYTMITNYSELQSQMSNAYNKIISEKTQFFSDTIKIISLMDNS